MAPFDGRLGQGGEDAHGFTLQHTEIEPLGGATSLRDLAVARGFQTCCAILEEVSEISCPSAPLP